MKKLFIFIFLLAGLGVNEALAQLNPTDITAPELAIDLSPEYPKPGEEVTATLNDYSGGAFGSTVTWVLDGQVIEAANNQRQAIITAGEAGSIQKIQVVLTKPQGLKKVLETSLRPIYLDIVIEPQTRVPNFYLGRSLPSIGSMVNATALLSDQSGFRNPDLVYTWSLNQQVLENGPIRGRNQVSFETPRGSDMVLSLQVTEPGGAVLAKRSILLPSVYPKMDFYEVNSLFGINKKIISAPLIISGNSAVVHAEPYYLDSRIYNNPAIHDWKINGIKSGNTGSNPYEVTLQRTGLGGLSSIQFQVRDTKQVLQGADGSIQVNF